MPFDAFSCATASSFPSILAADLGCATSIDQTQKLAFVETADVAVFSPTTILASATWTPLVADKSIQLTPFISEPKITPGDFQEDANENNIDGLPQHLGTGFSVFEGSFKGVLPATIAKLEALTALSSRVAGVTGVYAFFLGRNSRITAKATGYAIPIFNFAIKDVMADGRNKQNIYSFRFYLKEDWSKDIKTFDASFDPIATLANPAS